MSEPIDPFLVVALADLADTRSRESQLRAVVLGILEGIALKDHLRLAAITMAARSLMAEGTTSAGVVLDSTDAGLVKEMILSEQARARGEQMWCWVNRLDDLLGHFAHVPDVEAGPERAPRDDPIDESKPHKYNREPNCDGRCEDCQKPENDPLHLIWNVEK